MGHQEQLAKPGIPIVFFFVLFFLSILLRYLSTSILGNRVVDEK